MKTMVQEELLSRSELAMKLKRSLRYVSYMQQSGFKFTQGRCTLTAAMRWLGKHGSPTKKVRR